MTKAKAKPKRPSNNPNGRPMLEDKKVLVGIYIPQSVIDKKGGKDAVRGLFKKIVEK